MHTFFCLSVSLSVCAIGSIAIADERPVLQTLDQAIEISPQRIAGIDRNYNRTTPWIEYGSGTADFGGCGQELVFDCFEPDGGGDRVFFGETYCGIYFANDMETENLTSGDSLTLGFAWFWYVNGPGTSEQCYVVVFTAEDFDDTC